MEMWMVVSKRKFDLEEGNEFKIVVENELQAKDKQWNSGFEFSQGNPFLKTSKENFLFACEVGYWPAIDWMLKNIQKNRLKKWSWILTWNQGQNRLMECDHAKVLELWMKSDTWTSDRQWKKLFLRAIKERKGNVIRMGMEYQKLHSKQAHEKLKNSEFQCIWKAWCEKEEIQKTLKSEVKDWDGSSGKTSAKERRL